MFAPTTHRYLLFLSLLAILAMTATGVASAQQSFDGCRTQASSRPSDDSFRSSPVMFIENAGQWPDAARFQVSGGPTDTMWLAEDAIWVTVIERSAVPDSQVDRLRDRDPATFNLQPSEPPPVRAVNIKLSFVGANPHPRIESFDRLDTKVSYFIGNDPDKWRPDVPVWGGVRYVDLYPGVDLEIGSEGGQMVQRLSARPGADLSAVRLRVKGADAVDVDGNALRLTTSAGKAAWPLLEVQGAGHGAIAQSVGVRMFVVTAPYTQTRVRSTLRDTSSSHFASNNPQSPVYNPADLLYGTFLGGSGQDHGGGIAVDSAGSAYVTGYTKSSNFPTTPGAFGRNYSGGDAFVIKLNPSGSALVYATFLGGNSSDGGNDITVDSAGSAYVTGSTDSSNFPTMPGSFDRSSNGWTDAFVAKLNLTGSGLEYATFLGGTTDDYGQGIALDGAGSAYVTGLAGPGFPTTSGAFDRSINDMGGAFVVKLNLAGSELTYATFLDGSGWDEGSAISVDGTGNAYITGETESSDFPTTSSAFDRSYNGNTWGDAFVAKLNPVGSGLAYATFLGGSGDDNSYGIAVDGTGSAYVAGWTDSTDFPTTLGAFDPSLNGDGDAFVVKLAPTGSGLAYGTLIGGSSGNDKGYSIAVDGTGEAYVTGETTSADFPVTPGAFDTGCDYYDAFVARLNSAGSNLVYATFLGGSGVDFGLSIAIDGTDNAYVTGVMESESSDFPTTTGAFDQSYNGGFDDAFVVKLAMGVTSTYTIIGRVTDASGHGISGVTVWAGSSSSTTTVANGDYTFTGLAAGTYNISPSRYLYAFSPPSRTVTVPPNATGQDFVQTPVVDLSVNRIEVAQVFVEQNDPISNATIPLIAEKDTLVRVYVGVSGATSVGGVSARLHIRQPNGTETIDSRPVNVWPVQAKQTPDPYSLQDTVNFRPPTKLLQGNVTFWADVDPANRIPETNESNNTGGQTNRTFEAGEPVRIAWTAMGYGSNPFTAIYPNLATAAIGDKAMRRFYPVAARDVEYFFQPGIPPVADVKFDTNDHHVLYLQKLTKFWEQVTSFHGWLGGRPNRLYGWISNEARTANGTCGAAASRFGGSWGGVAVGADYCDRSIGIIDPAVIFAHEVGHLLDATGLMHAPGSESDPRCEKAQQVDPDYPTPALYPSASILAHGLDLTSSSVLLPNGTYDIMAYCKPSWISPYNYFKLKEGFDPLVNYQSQAAGTAAATSQLLVSGMVYTPTRNVTFDSFYALTSTVPPSNSTGSDYCLEMRSSTGGVLVHRCFDLSYREPESGKPTTLDGFVLRMPYPAGTTQIVLTHLGTPIATRSVSQHAPTVRLISPNGGETWAGSGTHTVTWTASDLDGDPLHFALSYSTDVGASWIPAGLDLTGTQHALDVSMLPGGTSVLLRISATDGVNTTDDVSDGPFTVGRKPPMAFILSPEDGAHFFPGAAIWLEGRAFDLEDGTLGDAALRWSSNRDGVLGTGKLLITTLSPGEHVITLTATDSDGNTAVKTIRLAAGDRLFLPMVLRGQ